MIRLFTLLIKFCSSNISDLEWFSIESEKICIPSYKCPTCGAVGSCVDYHHPYQRDMIYHTHDGEPIREKVSITRVKCTSCGHTHALISGNLIPYGSYSIHFVLDVLMKYFLRVSTVEQICSSEGISHSTLYGWKKTFLKHKELLLGIMKSMETERTAFINSFSGADAERFRSRFCFSFLQGKKGTLYETTNTGNNYQPSSA